MILGSDSESPPAPTKRMPSTTERVELEIEPASWWICGWKKELLLVPCGGALAVLRAGMVLSNSCMLWASEVWITCWSTVITFDPTGAVPLMLVPVTVTSSTAAAGGDAGCANAGEVKKDVAATRAAQDPPTKSCCRKPSMLPSLYFAAFSPCGRKKC